MALTKPCQVCGAPADEQVDGFSLCAEHAIAVKGGKSVATLKGERIRAGQSATPGDVQGPLAGNPATGVPAGIARAMPPDVSNVAPPHGAQVTVPATAHGVEGQAATERQPFRQSPSAAPGHGEGLPEGLSGKSAPPLDAKVEGKSKR